jgi:hypothetical protein
MSVDMQLLCEKGWHSAGVTARDASLAIGERFVVEKQFREGIGGFSFCSLSHAKRR